METVPHWINNRPSATSDERSGDVYNPATGEVVRKVAYSTPADVDAAVEAASKALVSWRVASIAKRTRVLFAFRELVERRRDDIARLLTSEHGKVFSDAQGEVQRGLEVI